MKHRFTLLHTYFLRILNDGLDCIADVAREWCGDAAANHRRKIEALVLTPIAESLFCVLEKRTLRLILTPWSSKLTCFLQRVIFQQDRIMLKLSKKLSHSVIL